MSQPKMISISAPFKQRADRAQVSAHLADVLAHLDAEAVELTAQRPQFDSDVGDRRVVPLEHRYHHRAVVAHVGKLALNLAQQALRHAYCLAHRSALLCPGCVDRRGNRCDLGADLGPLRTELLGQVMAQSGKPAVDLAIKLVHATVDLRFQTADLAKQQDKPSAENSGEKAKTGREDGYKIGAHRSDPFKTMSHRCQHACIAAEHDRQDPEEIGVLSLLKRFEAAVDPFLKHVKTFLDAIKRTLRIKRDLFKHRDTRFKVWDIRISHSRARPFAWSGAGAVFLHPPSPHYSGGPHA